MNLDLKKTLDEIGINAVKASKILNSATTSQKNRFFDIAIQEIKNN